MKSVKFIVLLILSISLLFGCASVENEQENIQQINEEKSPKKGGSINISVTRFDNLNPLLNNDKSLDHALKLIYDSLFTLDENYNIVPKLVNGYELSNYNTKLNITLKDNIKWHDGANLTSEDVKFTIEFLKKNNSPYSFMVENIQNVNIIDNKNLEIIFTKPYAFAVENLIFPIIPRHIEIVDGNSLIGNGMYKVAGYEKRRYIKLIRNEDYYSKKPYIDEINILIVPDTESQENMLLSFETHINKADEVISGKFPSSTFNIHDYTGRDYEFLALNFNSEYIKDINFRKALAYSINKNKILNDIYLNKGKMVSLPIYPESKYYDKAMSDYDYDIDKAREYIKITEFEDINLKLLVNKKETTRLKIAYVIKESLKQIGVEVEIIEVDEEGINHMINSGNYDLALLGWTLPTIPDVSFMFQGRESLINYSDEKINELLSNLRQSTTEQEKIKNYRQVQKHVKDNIPYIGLVLKDSHVVLNKNIKGNLNSTHFNIYNGIENLYLITD
ncbi:peptide/nickel transport system substrate-binding protein [Alkalithermobacter thermoalcaliphilus JW-YL-7 = DSM 7308]|uniref:ABC-type transporter, periplasmic subunit n=1 Tax=Alkalithermobacter thermoalcaliphilus JW-YL-7 = DSM 7308 TaxID=1121328 RepID=A0A150FRH6_CLOPD|nr:ABC-type transporter, periplasmic subunit [[Clostridium] paradoxum JW-YL-7 = DSM 7308]SHK43871.1 peptide/nickel transport system substrate-binding protein [[Clostridium] paradoxum JW-YL-7 = DSM 7308]